LVRHFEDHLSSPFSSLFALPAITEAGLPDNREWVFV